jgi:hypothetical protein
MSRGAPIDDDPDFLAWVELWISGERDEIGRPRRTVASTGLENLQHAHIPDKQV